MKLPVKKVVITLLIFLSGITVIGSTRSYFNDEEKVLGNYIQVATWDSSVPQNTPTPSPTPTPVPDEIPITPTETPTPTPTASPVVNPGDIVINEIYYDSPQTGTDNEFEWFEVYNNSSSSLTLTDWTITDNTSPDNIPQLTIDSKGFAVIAANSTGFYTNFPGFIGSPVVFIVDNYLGNGLGNNGDRLILKDSQGTVIDQISYGDNVSILDPSIPGVGAGSSSERNPKGVDTDFAIDFITQNSPSPGN